MTTALAPIDFSAVPAHARGKSAALTALSEALNQGIKRLSIKGGTFRYIVGGQEIGQIEERHIDVVIVNAAPHVSRTLYLGEYVAGEKPVPPDCSSLNGIVPDEGVRNKQSENCATCPQNVKGSGRGTSRKCRYSQHLAIVLANDVGGEVLKLTAPAGSIFGEGSKEAGMSLQGYIKMLGTRSLDPSALVTRIKFDTSQESPTLGFTPLGWLTQAQYDTAVMQGKSDSAMKAITTTVSAADGVDAEAELPLPSGTPPVMQKQEKAVKPVKEAPAPAAEPVVKKAAAAAPAPTAPNLLAVLEEFADDE